MRIKALAKQLEDQGPPLLRDKYFIPGSMMDEMQVHPEVLSIMKCHVINLLNINLTSEIKFDVIFLRNVLIYFDQETCAKIINSLVKYLKSEGHLFIGLSESLPKMATKELQRVDNSIYQLKRSIFHFFL
jgi:chemotaxis protein methyltransferase CheR